MSGKPPHARISISCPQCGHLSTFDRGFAGPLECVKCGRSLDLSGMAP